MKKSLTIILAIACAVLYTGTASANDWSLYGSARVGTFYTNTKNNDFNSVDSVGRDRIKTTIWDLQTNSRVGAKVQGDRIAGRFEYGSSTDSDVGDTYANVRLLYGVWKFTEEWGLKVGKDYTPIFFGLSSQVFDNDANLWRTGNAYGGRVGQIAIEGMGFKFAAIAPPKPSLEVTILDAAGNAVTVDTAAENYLPKLEASYELKFADDMSIHVFGGWANYKFYYSAAGSPVDNSETINSYMVGVGGQVYIGPTYIKPQVSYYKNGAAAGWLGNAILNATQFSTKPSIDNTKLNDVDSLMAMLALGFNLSQQLGFEAGIGYLHTKADARTYEKNTYLEYYLQAAIKLAPAVYLIPEVGYRDYGELTPQAPFQPDTDLGGTWYAGAKWQIDF